MTDLTIIILSYNGKELLKQTLDSVLESIGNKLNVQIIVCDNGSVDGSVEMIKAKYCMVGLVENNANLGFSAGNNRAISKIKGEYVLFLNSDTKVFEGVFETMINKFHEDPKLGAATCRVELLDGTLDPACHRGFPTPWRAFCYYLGLEKLVKKTDSLFLKNIFGGYHLLGSNMNVSHEIDSCTGAFLMLPRGVGESVGWWDETYFMYGEDLDLCYKIKNKGLSVKYFPDVKILHLKHQSGLKKDVIGQNVDIDEIVLKKEIKQRTTIAFYDAMRIFYSKHYKNSYPVIVKNLVYWAIKYKKNKALIKILKS
ncbi:MAG: glycosyltransferase family 2 protein [bacterium]|nr:glycosyltransferase family 2 protein [bacterium]